MTERLDLLRPAPPKEASLAAVRAAMLAEAARPRTTWRAMALRLMLALFGTTLLVGVAALGSGAADVATFASRWLTLSCLAVTGPLLAFVAAQPGRPWFKAVAWLFAAGSAAALVLTRPASVAALATAPEWVCTASHVAMAVPAAAVGLWLLRGMAVSHWRAVAVGLAAGTTGALGGELFCGRDAGHVALFHLLAWGLSASAVLGLAARQPRRSYAP